MKTKVAVLLFFCGALAFGQTAGIVNPNVINCNGSQNLPNLSNAVSHFDYSLTGNCTLSISGWPAAVSEGTLRMCEDSTGGRSLTMPSGATGFGAINTGASKCNVAFWKWDGSTLRALTPFLDEATGYPVGVLPYSGAASDLNMGTHKITAAEVDVTSTGQSGFTTWGGATSGSQGFTVKNVAGSAILYIIPDTPSTTGQYLKDNGSTTCPTLPAGAPTVCHQLLWADVGGSTVASGTATMGTSAISANSCATVVTVSASGVATTDVITATFSTDVSGVTGYSPSAAGLYILANPTANNVNFRVCNPTNSSITPGSAVVLNWKVGR